VANVPEPEVMTLSEDAVIRVVDGLVAHAA
jgi:hypothetical protein